MAKGKTTLKEQVASQLRRAISRNDGEPLLMAECRRASPATIGYEDEQHSAIMAVTRVVRWTEYGDPLRAVRVEFGGTATEEQEQVAKSSTALANSAS